MLSVLYSMYIIIKLLSYYYYIIIIIICFLPARAKGLHDPILVLNKTYIIIIIYIYIDIYLY